MFDFDQLEAVEAVDHLRRVVLSNAPRRTPEMELHVLGEETMSSLDSDMVDDFALIDVADGICPFRNHRRNRKQEKARTARKPRPRMGTFPNSSKPKSRGAPKPQLLNCWCSFAAALLRSEAGWGLNRRRERLLRVERRRDREGRLGHEEPELMPRRERWLRSPFLEERGCLLRRFEYHGSTCCVEALENHMVGRSSSIYTPQTECTRCGCSAEFDKYGDRVCWCDSCQNKRCDFGRSEPEAKYSPSSHTVKSGSLSRWKGMVECLLRLFCGALDGDCLSHKSFWTRKLEASPIHIRRWLYLHGTDGRQAARDQQRALLQSEELPYQLTMSYQQMAQRVHVEAVEQKRWEKRMRSRWSRMLLSLRAVHYRKVHRNAINEVAALREMRGTNRRASHNWVQAANATIAGWGQAANATSAGYAIPGGDDVMLAAALGLDVDTYRLLKQLEQRDILPEDYDLLGRLDETVKSKTLSESDLHCFEIQVYTANTMTFNATVPMKFGMDYWRLPIPESFLLEETFNATNVNTVDNFAANFWKLPLQDIDSASTTATEEDVSSCNHSDDVCGVCLVGFDDGDELRVLPCSHYFHRECIDHWLLNSSTVCPVDKRDLRSTD